eukprot:UN20698
MFYFLLALFVMYSFRPMSFDLNFNSLYIILFHNFLVFIFYFVRFLFSFFFKIF